MGVAEFGEIILGRRRELRLTQEEVARRVGVHANYIGYLERGMRRPSDKTLISLARALDLDKAKLFVTLNPMFRDVVRCGSNGEGGKAGDGVCGALRELIEDEALLKEIGATREDVLKLRALDVFGEVQDKHDYARVYRTIREITN